MVSLTWSITASGAPRLGFAMPEPAELVAAADTLAEALLYKEAISTYSKAIELHPSAPAYFIKRYVSRG